MSPWQTHLARVGSLELSHCEPLGRFFTTVKGELLQIPFLVGGTEVRESCQSHTEEGKHLLPQSCTPACSAAALLGLSNGRKQNQSLQFSVEGTGIGSVGNLFAYHHGIDANHSPGRC